MGRGGERAGDVATFTWEEIRTHTTSDDKWLVVDGNVYDVTSWSRRHPGGSRLLTHYAGQDATEAFTAFHNDLKTVKRYLRPLHRGRLHPTETGVPSPDNVIKQDFVELRKTAESRGLFTPSVFFFCLVVAHIVMCEALAYVTLATWGTSWLPYLVAVAFYTIVQGQAGWAQHDFGHLSVFANSRLNHALHIFLMNHVKGAAADWWNHMHYQHHSKPNVLDKDPDVRLDALFVVGETMPERKARERRDGQTGMPYSWQQHYFFFTLPPLLFPLYFQAMVFRHTIMRRRWLELAVTLTFYAKVLLLYSPLLGVWGAIKFYFLVRCLESHWFVWVSQSNHIPMEIDDDKERPWVPLQLHATCNIEKSYFNDWFTGHLNFQIEHHLFPTMPRHNLYKIAPLVRALCEKHNLKYEVKPIGQAFLDIVRSLKTSGELWDHYMHAYG